MTRTQCDDHAELAAALAAERAKREALEEGEDRMTTAILSLERRIGKLELSLAKWGGIVAAIAALPVAWQVIQWLIRTAEAAGR